ncbi:hypothetical protein CKF54_00235 [Psittacicella hinzii]|uniref:Outer membrane transport energization protein ExbD n=1 Tax=Psittacicella hinzii TaxID=2028575 RepID=A0A3A1YBA9_9GAMM|nr:biopolymer transporter ExbD [Psittacicella hinzii]RIY34458.1 hypothetical protein CKF54_00235 [Psittacicella hinzii]
MAFGSFNSQDEEMSEINITPLVDVMLVLLIVFMLAMPVFTSSVNISLPKSSQQKMIEAPQMVALVVNKEGEYFYKDQVYTKENLTELLTKEFQTNPDLVVTIRADQEVSYKYVISLLDLVKSAGISKIGFVSEPEKLN